MTNHLATACFQVGTSDTNITISNVPFTWDHTKDRDEQAAYAVASYIGEHNLTDGKPVTLIFVETSKAIGV